ncbi:MAG TPA: proton-conducting transporter membrane subunit, partial [Candidatus Sulfotelmatobacter sp.]|nr:proton-conducting transporter membrane subunit [Candidatus Sulfotelmatobacter sp.]
LSRLSLDLFKLEGGSWASWLLMTVGALTIILAVMMALVQKDYKKLLSYHAISQVGYMVLGIGTMVPAGIIGGLFHMINNALYKSCLFLTGGAVEKEAGTTDIDRLGGLGRQMPITFACFIIAALSISGVPPFNGFFSKELVYDGALERNIVFYVIAVLGSFFTAASFLKLGHAVYLGSGSGKKVKEAHWTLLVPMIVIAAVCLLFGFFNVLPVKYLLQPIVGATRLEGREFFGWPANIWLVVVTGLVLLGALANHWYGVKKSGKGAGAVDHIHYAPLLHQSYDLAEKKAFDPYEWGMKFAAWLAGLLYRCDRAVDWLYDGLIVNGTAFCSRRISAWQNGNVSRYVVWAMAGAALLIFYVVRF